MIFLATLPRSGSSLLAALLNQRPDVYASRTSTLYKTIEGAVVTWETDPVRAASDLDHEGMLRYIKVMMDGYYDTDKLVFDKARDWLAPRTISTLKEIMDVKIVTTIRPLNECLKSFANVLKSPDPENYPESEYVTDYFAKFEASLKAHPESFLIIEYKDLVSAPQGQLDRVSDFVGLPRFTHDMNNIQAEEEVNSWNIPDLHTVRPVVGLRRSVNESTSPLAIAS